MAQSFTTDVTQWQNVDDKISELESASGQDIVYASPGATLGLTKCHYKKGDLIDVVITGSIEWSRIIVTYNKIYGGGNERLIDNTLIDVVKGKTIRVTAPEDITSIGLGYIDKTNTGDIKITFNKVNESLESIQEQVSALNDKLYNGWLYYKSQTSSLGTIPFAAQKGDDIEIIVEGSVEWSRLLITYNDIYHGGNNALVDSNKEPVVKGAVISVVAPEDITSLGLGYIKTTKIGDISVAFRVNKGDIKELQDLTVKQIELYKNYYKYSSENSAVGVVKCNIKKGSHIRFRITGSVDWDVLLITYNGVYSGGNNVLIDSRKVAINKGEWIDVFATESMSSIGLGFLKIKVAGNINIDIEVDYYNGNAFAGKKITFIGSSITQGEEWCKNVINYLGADYFNCGVGGSKITGISADSLCQMTRLMGEYGHVYDPNTGEYTEDGVAVPIDTDILVIEGGVNDWAWHLPMGDRNIKYNSDGLDVDVTTFYGACHQMFVNISNYIPTAKVVVVGDVFGKLPNRSGFNNPYGISNNLGLQLTDYADALVDIAGLHGHYAFNMGRETGVNDKNVMQMGDGLHPNQLYSSKMARVIIKKMLALL